MCLYPSYSCSAQVPRWSSLLSVAVVNTRTEATYGRKGLVCLRLRTVHHRGKPRQNRSRDHRGILLAGFLSLTPSATFLILIPGSPPRDGPAHSGLDSLPNVNQQLKCLSDTPTSQSMEGPILSWGSLFSGRQVDNWSYTWRAYFCLLWCLPQYLFMCVCVCVSMCKSEDNPWELVLSPLVCPGN